VDIGRAVVILALTTVLAVAIAPVASIVLFAGGGLMGR
jgi:hypothetical protein